MPEPMNPADVPDHLVNVAAKDLQENGLWGGWGPHQAEAEVRSILAAVLPLHALHLGAKLGALTFPCPNHPTPQQHDHRCVACNRYTALLGARRIIDGRDWAAEAVRQLRADTKPAFLITTDDTLSKADAEQLLADLQIIPRPTEPS